MQQICRRVRDLVHAVDPAVEETIKRRVQPYFVLEGNVCALLAAKDHVNVFLYDGAIVPDPEGIITGGHDNKTARTVAFREGEPINEPALRDVPADSQHRAAAGSRSKPPEARPELVETLSGVLFRSIPTRTNLALRSCTRDD